MKHIKGFDGLRFFSILFVFLSHLGAAKLMPDTPYMREHFFYFFSGGAGVNIFFAISGFLITTLLLHEKSKNGRVNIKKFFIRRFLRLLPPILLFYIAVAIFMYLGYIRESYIGLTASILYLYNFIPMDNRVATAELSHTWSLAVEEQFYLTWPFIINLFSRKKIYFLVSIIIVLSFLAIYFLPSVEIHGHRLNKLFYVDRWIIPAITPIMIGAVVALYNHTNIEVTSVALKSKKWLFISIALLCVPFYLPTILFDYVRIFHSVGASLLLLWVFHNQSSGFVGVLETKVISYLGKISYGLYIWQGFFIGNGPKSEYKVWVHAFPVNILLTVAVAILSYEFYEKKILVLKQKYK